ncbi:MAG: hypothetical protein HYY06_01290 [Deltaproteobacteria bacterium]|nr:hypothetical protein [Deltaproteobacteria bacterium]
MRPAILLLVLACPSAVDAQKVLRADVDGAAARELRDAAIRCGATGLELVEAPRPPEPAAHPDVIAAVRAARQATLEAEFDSALETLARLREKLDEHPELAGTGRIWAEAAIVDAFARWSKAGGPEQIPPDVADRLDEAVSFWPGIEVDRDLMPPAIDRALDAAKRRRLDLPLGEVEIGDSRIDPWVWVSGIPEDAPRVMRQAGRFIVASVDSRGELRARIVVARPGERGRVTMAGAEPSARVVSALAGREGAIAVWGVPRGVRAVARIDGEARTERAASVEDLALRLGLCRNGAPDGDRRHPEPPTTGGGVPGWVYVAVGGAIVAAGGTVLALALTSEPTAQVRFRLP